MQSANKPGKIVLPFAATGSKRTIPATSQIGITAGAASLPDGFPPLTMIPETAGGVGPSGMDMNGILYELSAITRWANAGGGYPYDAAFASDSNVGGYPKGARVMRTDGQGYWLNTVDDNATNPETGGDGWVPDFSYGASVITMTSTNYTLSPLEYGKPVIVITGLLTADLNLIFPSIYNKWVVLNNTTGGHTITGKTATGTGVLISAVTPLFCDATDIRSNWADLKSPTGASLVGFVQAGVGAVLRTLQDKARERISVKDFGATGDGVTDDVDAINAAVTYLVSRGGGILFFPKGTYLVGEHIKVRDYITYEGEGWSTVVKAMASSVDNVFGGYGPDYDFDIQSPVIRRMCIDGNNTGVAYNDALAPGADDAYQNVIRMHRWKNAIIQNCLIRNAVFNGISCYHGCHGSKIVNNYIASIGKSPDPAAGYYSYNGIFLEWYGDNIEISDNIITGTRQASIICQVADTGGMSKIGIRRNRCFLAQTEGIIVKDQSSGATGILDDFWIEDNYVQQSSLGGSTAAIRVERNSPGYFAFNFKIASNTIKDSSYIGLLVNTGAKSTLLVDNTVYSSGNKGIIDAGEDTEITSCTSLNNVGANLDITSGTRTRVIGGQYLATGPNEGQRGTFTPTVLNGGAAVGRTYATQSGSYVVRGNRVEFNISIVMTAKGSSTGALTIGGLPFASKSSGAFGCPNINVANVTYAGIPFGLILNSSALINVYTQSSASTSTAMTDTALANNSEFYITGSYEV